MENPSLKQATIHCLAELDPSQKNLFLGSVLKAKILLFSLC